MKPVSPFVLGTANNTRSSPHSRALSHRARGVRSAILGGLWLPFLVAMGFSAENSSPDWKQVYVQQTTWAETMLATRANCGELLNAEELHRIALWLDCLSVFYGVFEKEGGEAQLRGEIARPTLE